MNILGLSAFFHESACCLLRDGVLVAAAEEERFSRVKHDPRLPVSAFRFCLEAGGIGITEVDCVAYYEVPILKLTRQLWSGIPMDELPDPGRPERMIREMLGWEGPVLCFEHHASHAASAFFGSGFSEAAVLTVDGVGEWATTTYGTGRGAALERISEVEFPHSLGLLYSAITSWLGFAVNDGEYKVMGLAPYGTPRFLNEMRRLVQSGSGGQFRLDLQYFDFINGRQMFSPRLSELLGAPPRQRGDEITQLHRDVARSVQAVLEEVLLEKADWLHRQTGLPDLCMAGGVALNVVTNGRILREGPFERLFVQPAAGDSGGCLGAAALAHAAMTGQRPRLSTDGGPMRHAFLGPRWNPDAVADLVAATGLPALDFRSRTAELLEAVVDRLARGEVVGWFHGAMEMGPRALGARSLLADPRDPGMRDRLNRLVKKREAFRPFAPSVLADRAAEHFALDHPSPFMLETCAVTSPLELPAVTHVDGSARPQTVDPAVAPRYAALLEAFRRRTGCPLLVNTSFNVAGEPIVASPVDALFSLGTSGIDALVLEDFLLDRAGLPDGWGERLAAWRAPQQSSGPRSAISEELYTFV